MRTKTSLWFWHSVWVVSLLVGLGVFMLYAWLPADGATGDLESFTPEGFRVQWLLEEREGGLQVEDVIVRAGSYTVDEWLSGASRGAEWRTGGVVTYEILRNGQPTTLQIQLAPVSLSAVLVRWAPQLAASLALLTIGSYVFWKRPHEPGARTMMLFCVSGAVQLAGDAYNFQYAILPWPWVFWSHRVLENLSFSLIYASICHSALIFPTPHPLIERFPRLVWSALYAANPLAVAVAMASSSTWSEALSTGNRVSLLVAMPQVGVALAAAVRNVRTARDPVTRAQIGWIAWGSVVGMAVAVPGYVLPLALTGRPLIPRPVTMLFTVFVPFVFGMAILRYRLFDIEIIINRTLVYGTLTTLLGGLYLLLVRLLALAIPAVLHRENDTLVVFVATLSIALAFMPLRQQVQALIDRAFYRIKLDYQRLLPEMSERLATSIVPDQLATLLTEELPQRLQIAWAMLAVLDLAGEHFVSAGGGDGRPTLPVDHPLVEHLHRLRRPLMRLQPPSHLPAEAQAFLEQHSIELSIPLIVGTELVGLYNLGTKLSGDAYNRYEVRLLHLLGQQAAVAVENSRLFQAEREQRRLTEALQEAAEIVSSTLDLDQVLDRILEQVERVVAGDAFNIMMVEGGSAWVVRWRGYKRLGVEGQIASFSIPITEYPTLAKMIRTGEPIVVPDTVADPEWVPGHSWEWLRSYVSAPIRVAGLAVGFLNVGGTRPDQFSPADAQRLKAFAHHAATALENAHLYAEVKQSLEEKEVLLKEIHHRVKNNLQVISSLLYLQAENVKDKQVLEMFQDSQSRVRSMALVHERLYQSPDLARVDFAEYLRSLVNHLFRSYGVNTNIIQLKINVGDVSLGIDTVIPCGLIINELVSNCLKHAFPDGREGEIRIELRPDNDGQCTLMVSDNGVGFPKYVDLRNTESLGLRLVDMLVNQFEGTIELDRSVGTAFKITFTEPRYEEGG